MNIRQLFSMALLAVSTLLNACGGGADSTQAGINGGGINGGSTSGVAVGPITGFGSIFVNGIEFDLTGSNVTVDENSGQSFLRVGQIVTVKGSINQTTGRGTAAVVEYNNNLRGVVSAVDAAANTFSVIGQTVSVTGATVFEGRAGLSLATLNIGDGVEVSGFVNATNQIIATRVELKTVNDSELSGVMSALSSQTFTIGTTTVSYSGNTVITGTLAAQACVEVKGAFTNAVLIASTIQVKSCGLPVATSNNDIGEIEGIITTAPGAGSTFNIGAVTVSIAGPPSYVNGSVASLTAGTEVEVEGTFNSSGVLNARKIEIKQGTSIRMSGLVDSVSASAKTLSMFGVTVTTNAGTQFVNKLGQSNQSYALSDVRIGDFVEVRGYDNQTHTAMTAVTLEHRNPDNRYEVRAVASDLNAPFFKLFGSINVNTSSVGSLPPGFFNSGNNDLVRVRGNAAGAWTAPPTFNANDLEIEEAR